MPITIKCKRDTPTPPTPGDGTKDDSPYDHPMTVDSEFITDIFYDNAIVGDSAAYFTVNDQQITSPASSTFNLGTEFTIGTWMKFNPAMIASLISEGGARIISNYQVVGESANDGYELELNTDGFIRFRYYFDEGYYITWPTTSSVIDGSWHHVAVQRESAGTTLRVFIDGVSESAATGLSTVTHQTVTVNPFTIGRQAGPSLTYPFTYGAIDELEIINGVAKYNPSGFTPSTTPITPTANHVLLMHFEVSNPQPAPF
jgi:hypothetical protein